jgi:hypothetical protein
MTPGTIEAPTDATTVEAVAPLRDITKPLANAAAAPLSPAGIRLDKLRGQRQMKPLTEPVAIMDGEECFVSRKAYVDIMGIFRDAVRGTENIEGGLLLTNPDHRAALVSSAIFHCVYADKEATQKYFGSVEEAKAWALLEDEQVSLAVGDLFSMVVELNPSILK